MSLVVDVQFFKTSDKTKTPKELAIFDGLHMSHFVFKPPYQYNLLPEHLKKEADWIVKYHHGIRWEDGHTPLYLFENILKWHVRNAKDVYVKGKEKADFLRKILNQTVIELPEQPRLNSMEPMCLYHSTSPCFCALSNVYYLYNDFFMK